MPMATDINPGLSAFCINKVVYDKLMTFWEEVGLLPSIFEGMIKLEYHNIQMNHHRQLNLWPFLEHIDCQLIKTRNLFLNIRNGGKS